MNQYRVLATSHYGPTPKTVCLFSRRTLDDAVRRIAFYKHMQYTGFIIIGPDGTRYNHAGNPDNV